MRDAIAALPELMLYSAGTRVFLSDKVDSHTMSAEDVAVKVRGVRGVKSAFVLDDATVKEIFDEEDSVVDTTFGMKMDNRALAECKKRSCHICVFCDSLFEVPVDHVMTMEDGDGRMVGFDIPKGREDEFRGRDDIIFLSDDFALSADAGMENLRVVMLPQKVVCVGEADGIRDPVLYYPVTTTDIRLKERFGIPDSRDTASSMLSFDII